MHLGETGLVQDYRKLLHNFTVIVLNETECSRVEMYRRKQSRWDEIVWLHHTFAFKSWFVTLIPFSIISTMHLVYIAHHLVTILAFKVAVCSTDRRYCTYVGRNKAIWRCFQFGACAYWIKRKNKACYKQKNVQFIYSSNFEHKSHPDNCPANEKQSLLLQVGNAVSQYPVKWPGLTKHVVVAEPLR